MEAMAHRGVIHGQTCFGIDAARMESDWIGEDAIESSRRNNTTFGVGVIDLDIDQA